jgi:hypothetical protein
LVSTALVPVTPPAGPKLGRRIPMTDEEQAKEHHDDHKEDPAIAEFEDLDASVSKVFAAARDATVPPV